VFRTDEDGAVTVRAFADGRMEIRTFHPRQPEKKGEEE
jgi:hypothetical protein